MLLVVLIHITHLHWAKSKLHNNLHGNSYLCLILIWLKKIQIPLEMEMIPPLAISTILKQIIINCIQAKKRTLWENSAQISTLHVQGHKRQWGDWRHFYLGPFE